MDLLGTPTWWKEPDNEEDEPKEEIKLVILETRESNYTDTNCKQEVFRGSIHEYVHEMAMKIIKDADLELVLNRENPTGEYLVGHKSKTTWRFSNLLCYSNNYMRSSYRKSTFQVDLRCMSQPAVIKQRQWRVCRTFFFVHGCRCFFYRGQSNTYFTMYAFCNSKSRMGSTYQ